MIKTLRARLAARRYQLTDADRAFLVRIGRLTAGREKAVIPVPAADIATLLRMAADGRE